MTEKHVHKFVYKEKSVLLHKVEFEEGKPVRTDTTGKDILKQWVCHCGVTQTYDLERMKV